MDGRTEVAFHFCGLAPIFFYASFPFGLSLTTSASDTVGTSNFERASAEAAAEQAAGYVEAETAGEARAVECAADLAHEAR